jgi:hypothetical protein
MNAKNFNDASDIDYFITNVESQKATGEWFVKTYFQRNWVEVLYREGMVTVKRISSQRR